MNRDRIRQKLTILSMLVVNLIVLVKLCVVSDYLFSVFGAYTALCSAILLCSSRADLNKTAREVSQIIENFPQVSCIRTLRVKRRCGKTKINVVLLLNTCSVVGDGKKTCEAITLLLEKRIGASAEIRVSSEEK